MNVTELVVDLEALRANIATVQRAVAPAELMLVVKDDAYGHGLDRVIPTAHAAGVRWFGAFDARTGAAVREAVGTRARVFVWLAGNRDDVELALAEDLDVGVGDRDLLEDVAAIARLRRAVARVHLKIDSGLHRNGVRPEEWPAFVERAAELQTSGVVHVAGLWSHLAEASDEEDDHARAVFDRACSQAIEAGLSPEWRHLAASAASFARPGFRQDMVRVGAFCYGIRPAGGPDETALGLRPIGSLRTRVVSVSEHGVHLAVGALDGLPSALAGRFSVTTPAGQRVVRRIDADQTIVDPWPDSAPGQIVEVYGGPGGTTSTATDLAESIGTIGEEIAVRISPSVPRRYVGTLPV
ncbi:alanine racemase [Microbacterium sp. P02]|uniref:alanine racemase n=1 Tax=Microbacterium sp. P02 TaxID=3366260 RepID=UPI00366C23E9